MGESGLHIVGLAGSIRHASYNRGLLRAAARDLPEGVSLQIEELSNIPVYNMDLEGPGEPPSVQALKAAVGEADALLLAIPEHNYSFSGVMKNAIDWLSRPFDTSVLLDKPVAIMGASSGRMGTARAQHAIRPVLAAMVLRHDQTEMPASQAAKVCDANGDVIDESTQKRVRTMVEALVAWTAVVGRH